uniref:Protein kinase domain-containing protein n=1 Tax=Ananas comosus var. bracteatus TaxID=296719 RepID=A0A6V7Q2V9_ANACO|nr:unnamed protein product [Ananas comosus var. bracteatus]
MGSSYSSSGGGGCYIARRDGRSRRRGGSSDGIIPCKKMVSSLAALRRRGRRQTGGSDDGRGRCDAENRSWLLADAAAGDGAAELHSVHSSFRLSFRGSPPPPRRWRLRAAPPPPLASPRRCCCSSVWRMMMTGRGPLPRLRLRPRLCSGRDWIFSRGASLRSARGRCGSATPRYIPPLMASLQVQILDFDYSNYGNWRELGRGPLSRVYRGRVGVRRRAVAIKRVEGEGRESTKAFCRELMIASSLCNPNIVPLIGFCIDKAGLFLVYKFVSGGSLDRLLHHSRKALPWTARYKVAMGVAQAVEYLHYGTEKCVIHRDIKSSNILLSSKKSPKLCDFGFATWARGTSLPFLCKSVKGTFGYLAPEYFQHGKLSDKTDSRPQGDENLVLWARPLLQQGEGAMEKLLDPRIKLDSNSSNDMSRMVHAATACLSCEDSGRPSIDQVIAILQGQGNCGGGWPIFMGHGCFVGYGSTRLHGLLEMSDVKSHLALAMLGVSDSEDGDIYSR